MIISFMFGLSKNQSGCFKGKDGPTMESFTESRQGSLTSERYPLLLFFDGQLHPEVASVESIVLVARQLDGSEKLLVRSRAIREVLKGLPPFRFFAIVLQIVPLSISDIGYRIFSKIRTPLFGRLTHCRVPLGEEQKLFVE
jgi:predicted DCC family thiol-disulfide oxidoreductase YuxK